MTEIQLWIPGKPKPKERPRMTRRGRVYTPAATLEYEAHVASHTEGLTQLEGPVELAMDFHTDGVFVWAWEVDCPSMGLRGDLDNYVKSVMDGLQKDKYGTAGAGVLPNDRAVVRLTADKTPAL